MIIDLEKEKEKIEEQNRYACPKCAKKGEYCPAWIVELSSEEENFEQLSITQKLQWLYHTRHLRRISF